MRKTLPSEAVPEHIDLAYHAWAPVGDDGKVPDQGRAEWFSKLENVAISQDYRHFFKAWKESFEPLEGCTFELQLAGRLLVGHGNASGTDVGLTVHHTWGVPIVPGSALKGLLAHYVDAVYGPGYEDGGAGQGATGDQERTRYQGVRRHGGRVTRPPGDVFRALFGAPEAEEGGGQEGENVETGASAGLVVFHDALYVPDSAKENKPFVRDVLTVHQKHYYDSSGGSWPNDYDSPVPVPFLTVRPGTCVLVALSGPQDWTALAAALLKEALKEWGVGGKTSAGYGRLRPPEEPSRKQAVALVVGQRVEAILLEERTKNRGWKARHEASGRDGPIVNSPDVPPDARPGQRVILVVQSVAVREVSYRYPTDAAPHRKDERKRSGR